METFGQSQPPPLLRQPLDYRTPDKFHAASRRQWPRLGVWIALIAYTLALITPSVVTWGRWNRNAEFTFGWETAFGSLSELPRTIRHSNGGRALAFVLFAPLLNIVFIASLCIEFASIFHESRREVLQSIARVLASVAVPFAIIGIPMFVFTVCLNAGLNGGKAVPIGVIPWIAAYLTLGLRLRRRHRTTGTLSA